MKSAVILYETNRTLNTFFTSCFLHSQQTRQRFRELFSEDYYLGVPGSKLFYRTTSADTQEKYHYSECKKKLMSGDQLKIESCVSSYWLKAKSM